MSETMPENMWMDEADMMASVFFTQEPTPSKGYERYIIKSTVDAEREADRKTIRELAAALDRAADRFSVLGYIECVKEAKQALTTHAPRIAEAQEDKR